jgi:putative PIN family toxin of toxin-antitoxin system
VRRGVPRAVLDPGVVVSALISPRGVPAKLLLAARAGSFELIVSPKLLGELESVMRREKFRRYFELDAVSAIVRLLRHDGELVADPAGPPPVRCADPGDDYLIALAHTRNAALVSGDRHLLDLAGKIPVFSPSEFLAAQL